MARTKRHQIAMFVFSPLFAIFGTPSGPGPELSPAIVYLHGENKGYNRLTGNLCLGFGVAVIPRWQMYLFFSCQAKHRGGRGDASKLEGWRNGALGTASPVGAQVLTCLPPRSIAGIDCCVRAIFIRSYLALILYSARA